MRLERLEHRISDRYFLVHGATSRFMTDITIRFAESDDDVINIHRFLCAIAGPMLPGPINPQKSIEEVWRVASDEVALMAIEDDQLIGTMGIIRPGFWWGDIHYLVNRWLFAIPGSKAWRPLLKEALAIAAASELELHIISEERGKVLILNKSKVRGPHVLRQRHKSEERNDERAGVAHERRLR